MKYFIPILLLVALCLGALPVSASAPAGGSGWLTINCDTNGASVYLDDTYKGVISGGSLDIADGAYAATYTVKMSGYYDASGEVNYVPGGDANLEIAVTLTPKPVGNSRGWINVYCNVDGAAVAFDGVTKGKTSAGVYSQEVSTTGTPYTSYTVSKSGYETYYGTVSSMPTEDETISLYATLNKAATTVATTSPTLIGGASGFYQVTCNVNGASVYFDSNYQGKTSSGSLTVPVYLTGTPYKTYRVEKSGYTTVTGTMPSLPAKDKTVTFAVTLSPSTTQTVQTTATTASPAGSEQGYIVIHSNVDGATVTIASYPAGVIKNGVLRIPVSTTGTPFSEFTVSKTGYATTTGTVPRQPSAGETVDIYVTLTAQQATTTPTQEAPVSVPVIIGGLFGAALLAGTSRIRK
ncbi:PEGA domain-containing protein [Methanoregula sp.]|uniref:PEGA domain-containing protein n=1 Tax=Methanoregula sp. TaxID=2052170 RepID=UPI00236BB0A7|nr:PEGA domain-containing protein [Methanoregula sp.]MDD1687147.1 PEGA domain-containing protein [Methanoregula sp.]